MVRFTKFVKVNKDTDSEAINSMITKYDEVMTKAINLIPLADVISTDDEDGVLADALGVYKDCMDLIGLGFEYMIEQDNQIREIKKQNEEILKKLDKLSRKTTK